MKRGIWLGFVFLCTAYAQCESIPLVWQFDRVNLAWGEEWIHELLEGVDLVTVDDYRCEEIEDRSIVVVSSNLNVPDFIQCFERLHEKNIRFGVILLSDEGYVAPTEFYSYASFVFRNYWHKKFVGVENVVVFPLGCAPGFWKGGARVLREAKEREYVWSFAGQIEGKPTRQTMMAHLGTVPNFFIHPTHQWGVLDPNALSAADHRDLLLNTLFVPCPAGWWNLDSFRLCEALECGCIPIVEKFPLDYFRHFLGEHPFLSVTSWAEAPALMNALLKNPEALEALRLKCQSWWVEYKHAMNKKLVGVVTEAFNLEVEKTKS